MSKESSCISLRGVITDNRNSKSFSEEEAALEVTRLGNVIGGRLEKLVECVDEKSNFVFWDWIVSDKFAMHHADDLEESFGLFLRADTFYINSIRFSKSVENCNYDLVIIGNSNSQEELNVGENAEIYITFDKLNDELRFNEAYLLGKFGHGLGDYADMKVNLNSQLKIMHIADRATNIFLKMCILPY